MPATGVMIGVLNHTPSFAAITRVFLNRFAHSRLSLISARSLA